MSFPEFRGPETLAVISPWLTDCELGWTHILSDQEKVRLAGNAIKPEASKMHAWWTKNQSALQGGTWTDFSVKFLDEADPNWRQFAIQDYNNFKQGSLLPDQYTDAFWDAVRMLQRAGSDTHSPQQRISHIVSCANKDVKDSLYSVLGPDITKWNVTFDEVVAEIRKLDDHLAAPAPQPSAGAGPLQKALSTPANQLFIRSGPWGVTMAGTTQFDSEPYYTQAGLNSVFDLGSWYSLYTLRTPFPPKNTSHPAPENIFAGLSLGFWKVMPTGRRPEHRYSAKDATPTSEGSVPGLALPGEYIKSAVVCWVQNTFTGGNGVPVTDGYITCVSFTTNRGRLFRQGIPGYPQQSFSAPTQQRIVGIFGTQSGDYFRTIGFLTGPVARGDSPVL